MKKVIYTILSIITIVLISYVIYYILTKKKPDISLSVSIGAATTTQAVGVATSETNDKSTLVTKTGKKIKITEENPVSEDLSTIILTPNGFSMNSPIIIEKNKLIDFFLLDLNKDNYDELIMITESGGSGSYGEAIIYTTASDTELAPVSVPDIRDSDMKKGGLFEGYMGHDSFDVEDGTLVRTFPTYLKKDTNDNPTGPTRKIFYLLVQGPAGFTIVFSKGTSTPTVLSATTTPKVPVPTPIAKTTPTPVAKTTTSGLANTSWTWLSTISKGIVTKAPTGGKFVLTFDAQGSVSSKTDCNTLRGDYAVDGTLIEFGSFTSTMMYCEGSRENEYSSQLSEATSYTISAGVLTLVLSNGDTMSFAKK